MAANLLIYTYLGVMVLSWVMLLIFMMILKFYAKSRGIRPAHAWKLFPEIWKDRTHPKRPMLMGLILSFGTFMVGWGVGAIVGIMQGTR